MTVPVDPKWLWRTQEAVLVGLTSLPPRLARDQLYALPPWRAAMLARIAHSMGVMERAERDAIIREAALAGGDGTLKPWRLRTPRERSGGVHSAWTDG